MIEKSLFCLLLGFVFERSVLGANDMQTGYFFTLVPEMAMRCLGNSCYMSSTTMRMCPGLPILKSNDLMNCQLVSYAYGTRAVGIISYLAPGTWNDG